MSFETDIINNYNNWTESLSDPLEKNKIKILQEIQNKFKPHSENETNTFVISLVNFIKTESSSKRSDKRTLEFAFRSYYRILCLMRREDDVFLPKMFTELDFQIWPYMLHACIITQYTDRIGKLELEKLCIKVLNENIAANSISLPFALRSINALYKTREDVEITIPLSSIYFCMQCPVHCAREETIRVFEYLTKCCKKAILFFSIITNFWPWSNKTKYHLLAVLINNHGLYILSGDSINFKISVFLGGLRDALSHKNLFACSQNLVKALMKYDFDKIQHFLLDLLQTGSKLELMNLSSQWARHITNKDKLYEMIGLNQSLDYIHQLSYLKDNNFRFIIIHQIFLKEFSQHHQAREILEYMQSNFTALDLDVQLIVYRITIECLVTSIGNFSNNIDFISNFIGIHLAVQCACFRQTVLGKLPQIFDYIAKSLTKIDLKIHIRNFFLKLKEIFLYGISKNDYQPLIFSLKIFDTLIKATYQTKGLVKNTNYNLNEQLRKFLYLEEIWPFEKEYSKVYTLLGNAGDYDDVRELIVEILKYLHLNKMQNNAKIYADACMELCNDTDIDKCFLSSYYAELYANCNLSNEEFSLVFNHYVNQLLAAFKNYEIDPLQSTKNGRHLFGYVNSMNKLFTSRYEFFSQTYNISSLLIIIEEITSVILNLLNKAGNDENDAPSFQTMEESLEMLVEMSKNISLNHDEDRKYLLLSFWMSLQSCCDLSSNIGCFLINENFKNRSDSQQVQLVERSLKVITDVLRRCRHKGAIESAGVSLGKLVNVITTNADKFFNDCRYYQLLYSCFSIVLGDVYRISTTRRGAGLSILFLQLVKNDVQENKNLFQRAIDTLLEHISYKSNMKRERDVSDQKYENLDALVLHYLCVLVKDSNLKNLISEYYDNIMLAAISRIEENEWTIRNGALQLFGALVPKIVGQKQLTHLDQDNSAFWIPSEITFTEIITQMPKTIAHILKYCNSELHRTSSVILFLEFLSSIDYMQKNHYCDEKDFPIIVQFRNIFWRLLSHRSEKVRKLSSRCLAKFHEFRYEIPKFIFCQIEALFDLIDENFQHGILLCLIECLYKFENNSKCINDEHSHNNFLSSVREHFFECYKRKGNVQLNFYIRSQLSYFFKLAKFNFNSTEIAEILGCKRFNDLLCVSSRKCIGYEIWKENVLSLF